MVIRQANESDLEEITCVMARTIVAAGYEPSAADPEVEFHRRRPRIAGYSAGTYHPRCALPERAIFIAEGDDGNMIGFIAGHRSTRMRCTGELQWMFVLPQFQRRGVGSALLRALAEWFVRHQSTRIIIDAPPEIPARAFYLKHGASPLDEYWLHWPDIGKVL